MRHFALATALLLACPLGGSAQERGALAPAPSGGSVASAGSSLDTARGGMLRVPTGSYVPAFAPIDPDGSVDRVPVRSFELDRTPVTVADFLAFLETEPRWRRSAAPPVLVGDDYLSAWEGDLDPGVSGDALKRPVTEVSWFAARAYCAARDARLPTTDEWEYAAALGGLRPDGTRDPAFLRTLRGVYAARPAADALPPVGRTFENGPGLWDLHGLVQEWTSDFNGLMTTGSGRDDQGLDRQLFCAAGSADATDRSDYPAFSRYSFRTGLTGDYAGRMLGFRCAR